MRSNDSIFGFKNDLFWHQHVLNEMYDTLKEDYPGLKKGNVFWNSTSLHVYESHFYLVYHYKITGENQITKSDFRKKYESFIVDDEFYDGTVRFKL